MCIIGENPTFQIMAELILQSSGSTLVLPDGSCSIAIVFAQTQFPITISLVFCVMDTDEGCISVFHSVGVDMELT